MSDETKIEVNTEDSSIPPKEEETETLPPDSSPEENTEEDSEGDEPEDETPETPEVKPAPVNVAIEIPTEGEIRRLADETDREFAQRKEIKRLRDMHKSERGKEILEKPTVTQPAKVESEVLKKYKKEEIDSLREVLPELAKELGYVKSSELAASSYEEKAQDAIDAFITKHPEYSPEKDPDSILWNQLKTEYQNVYKPPQNPKDFTKIFERIHKDIFGIQATGPLPKDVAAREKVKVASSTGASVPQRLNRSTKVSTGLRTDMLKGFSDKEISDIEARAE